MTRLGLGTDIGSAAAADVHRSSQSAVLVAVVQDAVADTADMPHLQAAADVLRIGHSIAGQDPAGTQLEHSFEGLAACHIGHADEDRAETWVAAVDKLTAQVTVG